MSACGRFECERVFVRVHVFVHVCALRLPSYRSELLRSKVTQSSDPTALLRSPKKKKGELAPVGVVSSARATRWCGDLPAVPSQKLPLVGWGGWALLESRAVH
jgi:hypothetical protein